MDEDKYNVEFSKEELIVIYNVFCQLESKCFAKWRSLWPNEGEKTSKECNKQWLLLGKIDEIKKRVAKPLDLSARKK